MQCSLLPFLFTLFATTALCAEDSSSDGDGNLPALEEIVVEATRAGSTVLNIPVNTSILSELDIREYATKSVDEILRQIPGFNLLRAADSIATAPTTSTVSLRGLGGTAASRTLVLLDGIPIHSPVSSEVYWARIPKGQIERVEVVRGGGANAWGNLSLGGVINIITKQPRKDGLDFTGSIAYPKTVDLSIAASEITERWELSGQASYYNTVGYYNIPENQRVLIDERVYKDYANVSGKATYLINEKARIFVTGSLFGEERHGGTPKDIDTTDIWTIGTGLLLDTDNNSQWRANLFYEEIDVKDYSVQVNSDNDEDTVRMYRLQPSSALGAGLVWSKEFAQSHTFTTGVDYRWTEITVNDFGRYLQDVAREQKVIDAEQDMGGVFIQDTWKLNDRWQLNGSLRYDYVTNQGSTVVSDLTSGVVTSVENYDRNSENTVNPSLGAVFRVSDGVSLRAAAYKGFRAATLRELFRSSSTRSGVIIVNNPALAPERLLGVEAGVDLTFFDNAIVRLTLFQNTVEDLIQNITRGVADDAPIFVEPCGLLLAGQTCRELDNVGEMQATGVELEAEYHPSESWSLFLSYLYNDSEVTKAPDNPQVVGKQVRQAPKHSFTARVRHQGRWFDTSVLGRYVGDRFEDDINTLPVDEFFVLDLRFSRQVSSSTEIFFTIENLLDEEIETRLTNAGDRQIGRPRFLGIGMRFSR